MRLEASAGGPRRHETTLGPHASYAHGVPSRIPGQQGDGTDALLGNVGSDRHRRAQLTAYSNIFVERLWRSVKYEDVYLKGYASMGELMVGLAEYFAFYNGERPHQSLGQHTPAAVYRSAIGGGALIVDKFGGEVEETPVPLRSTGVSSTSEARSEATATSKAKAKPGQRRPAASEVECTT